ncbi:MAG: hypothetical protein RQ723_11745 [Desulfuromonadales bacterium]|nr:hypothetical protein [Desulfuromonadales bacterium]
MTAEPGHRSDNDVSAPLHATLFGAFRIDARDGTAIDITGKRARAVLAILCLSPGVAMERARLCELLWQGRFQAQARASLRQTLLALKKQLEPICPDLFEVTRERISIRASAVGSDLTALETALSQGQWTRATELLEEIGARPLLHGFEFGDAFAHWLATRRERIEHDLKHAIEQALMQLQDCGNDPAWARLLAAWQRHTPGDESGRSETRIRIAVLPLRVIGRDDEQEIAQGLFEELVTALGRMPQLQVVGRGSALNVAKIELPLPELARLLQVQLLVQGSVQRQNSDLRVHVSLVDGQTGLERWSHGYPGSTGNLFALQDEIARAVGTELGRVLQIDTPAPPTRHITRSNAAYALYLQGRALTMRAIGDGVLPKAIELLEAALEIDPEFAAGWTALAEAYVYTVVYTPCLDRLDKTRRMAECATKAIELDPGQGHARAMLGIQRWTEHNPAAALDLAFEAYRLEPDNPDVILRLGAFLLYIGRTRQALPYIEAAVDRDPVNGRNFAMLSVARLNLGNIDGAIAAGQRMVDLGLPSMWLAVATAAAGDRKLAVEQYWQTRLLMNSVLFPPAGTRPLSGPALDTFWRIAARGVCSGRAVHRKLYCAMLDYLHATLPDPCDTSIVAPAIWMGYAPMVFKTVGTQVTPANMYCLMSLWADIEPIRRVRLHAGFTPFAKRIGLEAAWEKYGRPDLSPVPDADFPSS